MSSENKQLTQLEYRKQLAQAEADKYLPVAKEKVVVVMPFEAAWLDPTEAGMEAIADFASERKGSVHVFEVKKTKAIAENADAKSKK